MDCTLVKLHHYYILHVYTNGRVNECDASWIDFTEYYQSLFGKTTFDAFTLIVK